MNGEFFLDTNILVYTFDASAPAKQQIARQLVSAALDSQQGLPWLFSRRRLESPGVGQINPYDRHAWEDGTQSHAVNQYLEMYE